MKFSRRGLLGTFLAAPAIIRTAGLLMPIKPALADGVALPLIDLTYTATDEYLLKASYDRYEAAWTDWRGMWGNDPGDMSAFPIVPIKAVKRQLNSPRDANIDLSYARMRELKRLEAEVVSSLQDARRRTRAFPT